MSIEPDENSSPTNPNPLGELPMKALTIKDLAASKELDRKAMSAVRGGFGDQAIAKELSNAQLGLVEMNIGNGSKFNGPTIIQADSDFSQSATNTSDAKNKKFATVFGFL
jgi:hypothetical protein